MGKLSQGFDPFKASITFAKTEFNITYDKRLEYLRMCNNICMEVKTDGLDETIVLHLRESHIADLELPELLDDVMNGR